ncbi:MAG: hypothetical protein KGM24_11690 [Elusimicrobia bacterium]|nr:hypothetical protein [Elusimicrobiota bacterium]
MPPSPRPRALTGAQIRTFIETGWLRLDACFDAAAARPWIDAAWRTLGADPERPETWPPDGEAMRGDRNARIADFAPKLWDAICGLLGGPERVAGGRELSWSNSFVIRSPCADPSRWQPPSPRSRCGWHLDGGDAPRWLDSPEYGLAIWALWSDVAPRGGGTYLAFDSVPPVLRELRSHPEGIGRLRMPLQDIVRACRDVREFTGRLGDVIVALPHVVHAESVNLSKRPRLLTARMVPLAAPLDFARRDPADFSVVERSILSMLGVERLSFRRRAPAR